MKTLLFTLTLALLLSAPGVSQANGPRLENDTTKIKGVAPADEDEFVIDMEAPFFFQERVYIHIYDQNDKPLINASFTSKELKENKELRALLRKSSRFLSVDRHHYYYFNG